MQPRVVNLKEKSGLIQELHQYKLIAEMNNYQFKLVKAKRVFVPHRHMETDEVFFVVDGEMQMEIESEIFPVQAGELIVVPKGALHRPICDTECCVMLIEPAGTVNTGNAGGPMTDTALEWI